MPDKRPWSIHNATYGLLSMLDKLNAGRFKAPYITVEAPDGQNEGQSVGDSYVSKQMQGLPPRGRDDQMPYDIMERIMMDAGRDYNQELVTPGSDARNLRVNNVVLAANGILQALRGKGVQPNNRKQEIKNYAESGLVNLMKLIGPPKDFVNRLDPDIIQMYSTPEDQLTPQGTKWLFEAAGPQAPLANPVKPPVPKLWK